MGSGRRSWPRCCRCCGRSCRRRGTNRSCRRRSRGSRRHGRSRRRRLGHRWSNGCSGCGRLRCDGLCRWGSGNDWRTRFHGNGRHAGLWRRYWRGGSHPRGLRSRILRFFFRLGSRFHLRFGFGGSLKIFAHFLSDVCGDRARVRLLFRDAVPGQQVNDGFGFDLEFAGQLVNSDLIYVGHALRS